MNINYTQIREDNLNFKVIDEVIYIKHEDIVYKVDFSRLANGIMVGSPSDYIFNAERVNGELTVILRNPCDKDGNDLPHNEEFKIDVFTELFPKWKTKQEIEDEKILESLIPTDEEVKKAELEISLITLLQDLEVV